MTGAKPLVLLAYGLIGLALMVLAPLLHQRRVSNGEAEAVGARITPPIRMVFGMLIGLCAMAFLPWWVREPGHWFRLALSPLQVAAVLSLTFAVSWMLTRQNTAARDSCAHRRWRALVYAVFAMVLLCLVFSTGWLLTYTGPGLWHHWGAYVGPALLVAEGAHPWYDIPVQYGLGVTLLLAQGCQIDCWSALYWLAGAMTAAMTALLAYLALQFNGSRHPLSVLATVAIVLVCGLFWTANPRGLAAPLTYPSTTGLRFLPGVLVLTLLVRHARLGAVGRTPPAWGHVLWLACILWSPEAGLHATMLWAPYFVWLHTWAQGAGRPSIRFIRAAARLALVLVGGLTLTALGYRLLWGHFPEAGAYLVYLRHPPGPLPVNPWGTVWFALVCMVCWGLGWFYMARRACTNPGLATASWLSALFCFASFTYYLGRSHDNNILNLLPFFALMLQAARAIVPTGAVKTLSTTLLAACVGWSRCSASTACPRSTPMGACWSSLHTSLRWHSAGTLPGGISMTGHRKRARTWSGRSRPSATSSASRSKSSNGYPWSTPRTSGHHGVRSARPPTLPLFLPIRGAFTSGEWPSVFIEPAGCSMKKVTRSSAT